MPEFASIVADVEEKSVNVMKGLSNLRHVQTQNVNLFSKTKEFVAVPSNEFTKPKINAIPSSQSEKCTADAHVKTLLVNFTNTLLNLNVEHPTFLENFCHSFARFAALDKNEIRGICTKPEFKWLFNCQKIHKGRENERSWNEDNDSVNKDAYRSQEYQNIESGVSDDMLNSDDGGANKQSEVYPDILKKVVNLRTRWPRNRNHSYYDDAHKSDAEERVDDNDSDDNDDDDDDDDDDQPKGDKVLMAPNLLRQIALQVAKGEVQRNNDDSSYDAENNNSRQQQRLQEQQQQQLSEAMESRVATYLFRR